MLGRKEDLAMRSYLQLLLGTIPLVFGACSGGDDDDSAKGGSSGTSAGRAGTGGTSSAGTAGHGGTTGAAAGGSGDSGAAGADQGGGGNSGSATGGSAGKGGTTGTGGGSGGKGGASGGKGGAAAGTGGASAGKGGAAAGHGGSGGSGGVPATGAWNNATGNLANMSSECGNLGLVSAQPGTDMVVAGVAQHGLWATHDGGQTWTALGSGSGSATITNRISSIVWDPDDPTTFWESGSYNGGGVYKTTDNGETFEQLGDVTHSDSVSVDLSDPDRKTLLAGAHETAQKLNLSRDGGNTWNDIGATLPADSGYCTSTLVLDSQKFLVGCSGNGNGIYRTEDGGDTWTHVGTTPVWPQPLVASDGSIYWESSQSGLQKGDAAGSAFSQIVDGNTATLVIPPTTLAELPDGRIVVMGKDHLQSSGDGGVTWMPLGDPLPVSGGGYDGASGVTYSEKTKTFFIWRWTCTNNVAPDAIMSLPLQ
jgi:hypothetical protein